MVDIYRDAGRGSRFHGAIVSTLDSKSSDWSSNLGGSCKRLTHYRAPVAHLVVHRAVTREVVSSRLRPDQHSGSLNN